MNSSNNDGNGPVPQPCAPIEAKSWKVEMSTDIRNHIISDIIRAIFPNPDPAAVRDLRLRDLVSYARCAEQKIFQSAKRKSEYYFLLSQLLVKLEYKFDEKKQIRTNNQAMQNESPQPLEMNIPTQSATENWLSHTEVLTMESQIGQNEVATDEVTEFPFEDVSTPPSTSLSFFNFEQL